MSLTALAFLLAFLAGCGLALVRHPVYGLMTYVLVFFLHPPDRWWGQGFLFGIRWSLLAAAVTAAAIYIRKLEPSRTPLYKQLPIQLVVAFVLWAIVQLSWAIDTTQQLVLIEYYLKFVVVVWLINRCIETERHLVMFIWAYVVGCFYLAWLAFRSDSGGRFDWFGGPGIGDANAGALTLVTAAAMAGALLLISTWKYRAVLAGIIAILVNSLVMTISRSGFLALAAAGVVFNMFTPGRFRWAVRGLSIAAVAAFLMVTNQDYWQRMGTIAFKGADIQGVDTGSSRLAIMDAQVRMFRSRPLGCGHFCTDVLSASYLDKQYLTAAGARSSHNTFLSFLVDQGVVGALFYVAMVSWALIALRKLSRKLRNESGVLPGLFPAIAACLGALFVGDMFVPYVRYEPRFWFIALILVMLKLSEKEAGSEDVARRPDARIAGDR